MSAKNKAPEQIWVWEYHPASMKEASEGGWFSGRKDQAPAATSYTRTDVAQAMVAAAHEAAANNCYGCEHLPPNELAYGAHLAGEIRDLTPADAKAALDRIVQEAVKEALEKAEAGGHGADVDAAAWTGEWQWWAGRDDEWCTVGPEPTRDAVIDAAVADGAGEVQDDNGNWMHKFHIMEARQDPLRLSDWIGLNWLLERANESLADSDRVSCENDDGPWFDATPEQEKELCDRIRRVCDAWQMEHGLKFHSTTFSHARNSEYVSMEADALKGGEA